MSSGVAKGQRTHLPATENDGSQEPESQRNEKQKRRRRRGETDRRLRKKLKNRIRLTFELQVRKEYEGKTQDSLLRLLHKLL